MSGFEKPYAKKTLKKKYYELGLSEQTLELLHDYFLAFANFYGIIDLENAYKIISKQNKGLITKEQLYNFSDIIRREDTLCYIVDEDEMFIDGVFDYSTREIVAEYLLCFDDESYHTMRELQQGKQFYIPPKQELLKYADFNYINKTPEFLAMETFLVNKLKANEEQVDDVIFTVYFEINNDEPCDFEQVLSEMEMIGLKLKSKKDFETFAKLFNNVNNNTRMQINRGYTPEEMTKLFPEKDEPIVLGKHILQSLTSGDFDLNEFTLNLFESDIPQEDQLSILRQVTDYLGCNPKANPKRNDPCPCGSGKKYKNCCGRSEPHMTKVTCFLSRLL